MYVDSPTVTERRSPRTRTMCTGRREATPRLADVTAGARRLRPVTAAARRTRLADAIVSQWLLEQVPADDRHVLLCASDR